MAIDEDSRGTANRGTTNKGLAPVARSSAPLRQAQQQPRAANTPAVAQALPPATHRTIFVVQNDVFFGIPQDIRDVAIAEMTDAWAFIARLDQAHPINVELRKPDQFPQAMAMSDSVVTILDSEPDVTAHLSQAVRLQFSNARVSLAALNVNFQPPAGNHVTTAFEAGGQASPQKQVITAAQRRFALPVMSSAVSLESLTADVIVELEAQVTNAKTGKLLSHRKNGLPDFRFYASKEALLEASKIIAVENPTDPNQWAGNERELLGRVLGRAMAHEVRHLYTGTSHATDGLGTDSPLLSDPKFFRFSQQDEKDILKEIRNLEKQQVGATLVETFPASRRQDFPF